MTIREPSRTTRADPLEALRAAADAAGSRPSRASWWGSLLTALVALAAGLYLAVVPWTDTWSFNYWQQLNPSLEYLWDEAAFRGALSGLGIANLLIACQEGLRAFRRTSR
jgi:uncharacterized membrane protein YcjF (UPF0283 family)